MLSDAILNVTQMGRMVRRTTQRKNWLPFVFGPALAIDRMPCSCNIPEVSLARQPLQSLQTHP